MRKISQLSLISETDRRRVIETFNATHSDYPKNRCIHELFEEQVKYAPDEVAVVYEGKQLTYAGLNARANRLARHLRRMGVGPDVLVAICVERSLDMMVGLLGILKAGGAYVPLDPGYPPERIAYVLDDARPAVLLTQYHLRERLPCEALATFYLDTQQELLVDYPATDPGYAHLATLIAGQTNVEQAIAGG